MLNTFWFPCNLQSERQLNPAAPTYIQFLFHIQTSLPYDRILVWHVIEVWDCKRRWGIYIKGRELFQIISIFFSVHECKIWLQSKLSAQVKYAFVQLALTTVDYWGWNCPWKHCSDSLWINCSWTIPPIHIKHKKACFQHTLQKFGLLSFPGKHEYSG